MIQRIQTLYLVIAMVFLSIVTAGSTIFKYITDETVYKLNSFGFNGYDKVTDKVVELNSYPLYISTISLVLLAFITLMAYKNLTRQLKLARTTFYIYLMLTIGMVVFSFVGGDAFIAENFKRELGAGYLLFVAGLPFSFLANIAIKRDKSLIDSLNRLR
jgi:amino acid transporter